MDRDEKEILLGISLGKVTFRLPDKEIFSIFLKDWTSLIVVIYDETLYGQFLSQIYPVNLSYSQHTGSGGNTSVSFGKCAVWILKNTENLLTELYMAFLTPVR